MKRVHLRGISLAWALCGVQALISIVSAMAAAKISGRTAAVAALFGGVIVIVPGLYMAIRVYARRGTDEPKDILGRF